MQGLACPRCSTPLQGDLRCKPCDVHFPTLDGVAFLWPEPGAALLDWRNRFNAALANLDHEIGLCNTPSDYPTTRARIDRLEAGLRAYKAQLETLLAPLKLTNAAARELHLALRTALPSHHGIDSYRNLIVRDWSWGAAECQQTAAHIEQVLHQFNPQKPSRVLVLGAGAGRLVYELQTRWQCTQIVALDSNPLLCLVAQQNV